MKKITELLREQNFFNGLREEWIEAIADCGRHVEYKKKEFIFREGEDANHFYLLQSGKVVIETDIPGSKPVVIQSVSAGEVMGWSWLFPPYKNAYDALVVEKAGCMVFDGRCLRGKCEINPEFGYEFMQRFSRIFIKRLEATRLQVMDIYKGHKS